MNEERKIPSAIFAVRTTAGQEKNVANLIAVRVETNKLPIKGVPFKGVYLLVLRTPYTGYYG